MDLSKILTAQTFEPRDLLIVGFLVLLEGLLSADNAIVLAIMVRHLPDQLQKKALLYGLVGAFVFRFIAIIFAKTVLQLWWLQALGALYLLYLPVKHFWPRKGSDDKQVKEPSGGFWATVFLVEITDIAFAIDSVLAAVSAVGDHPDKLWVVYAGAMIGVILLRFAANFFVDLLKKFPVLDQVAYVIVGWVGVKLAFMATNEFEEFFSKDHGRLPFPVDVPHLSPLIFWSILAIIGIVGTSIARKNAAHHS